MKEEPRVGSPNHHLFRMMGRGINFHKRKIFDAGFGYGADLLEAQRRGAEIYGIDVNQTRVDSMTQRTGLPNFKIGDLADPAGFPFKEMDIVFTIDTIYYLDDDRIRVFADNCRDCLNDTGFLIIHFILCDAISSETEGFQLPFLERKWQKLDTCYINTNPIRFLETSRILDIFSKKGLYCNSQKTVYESFNDDETVLRAYKYLRLQKV